MNSLASMALLGKLKPETPVAKSGLSPEVLAKKAAQARARRAAKKAGAKPAPSLVSDKLAPRKRPNPAVLPSSPQLAEAVRKLQNPAVKKASPVPTAPAVAAGQGGKRAGAGPKSIYGDEVMRTISFKGTEAHHAEFMAAGGGAWVRAGLDERIAFKAKGGKA